MGLFITQLVRSSALFKECYGSNLDWNLVSLSNARDMLRQIPPQEYSENSLAILLESSYCLEKKTKKKKKKNLQQIDCGVAVLSFAFIVHNVSCVMPILCVLFNVYIHELIRKKHLKIQKSLNAEKFLI